MTQKVEIVELEKRPSSATPVMHGRLSLRELDSTGTVGCGKRRVEEIFLSKSPINPKTKKRQMDMRALPQHGDDGAKTGQNITFRENLTKCQETSFSNPLTPPTTRLLQASTTTDAGSACYRHECGEGRRTPVASRPSQCSGGPAREAEEKEEEEEPKTEERPEGEEHKEEDQKEDEIRTRRRQEEEDECRRATNKENGEEKEEEKEQNHDETNDKKTDEEETKGEAKTEKEKEVTEEDRTGREEEQKKEDETGINEEQNEKTAQ